MGTARRRTLGLARLALPLAIAWLVLMPSLALADDNSGSDGHSCSGLLGRRNPQCSAPEVPIAAVYPVVGGLSFAAIQLVRARRRSDDGDD